MAQPDIDSANASCGLPAPSRPKLVSGSRAPKTEHGRRTISLPPHLGRVLSRTPPATNLELRLKRGLGKLSPMLWCFHNANGTSVSPNDLRRCRQAHALRSGYRGDVRALRHMVVISVLGYQLWIFAD